MSSCDEESLRLQDAIANHDIEASRLATAELLNCLGRPSNSLPAPEAYGLLGMLMEHRWFKLASWLAESFAAQPNATPELKRRSAQMLMECGQYDAALKWLLPLRVARLGDQTEVLGHLGRIRKQQFVSSLQRGDPEPQRLRQAIEAYLEGYREAEIQHGFGEAEIHRQHLWLGINAVALLRLAERHTPDLADTSTATHLANILRKNSEAAASQPGAGPYDSATAAESCIALGDFPAAQYWLAHYAKFANVFGLGSTLRQLEEVWELATAPAPWPDLLDFLRAEVTAHTDGVITIAGTEVQRSLLRTSGITHEAVFGSDRFDSYDNYRRGLERCKCVARIGRSLETGIGTGFLLPGKLLSDGLSESWLLLTNAHVLSTEETERAQGALHPEEAVVSFAALDGVAPDKAFGVARLVHSSPPRELDFAVAELSDPITALQAYPLASVLPARGSTAKVRVIGHPSGRGLSLSSNAFIDHEAPKLHYRAATEGGSSGSPVFNQDWKLIGLHHAGGNGMPKLNGNSGTYEANEGIWIQSIRQALSAVRS